MPSPPKPPSAPDPGTIIGAGQQATTQTGETQQGLNQANLNNVYGGQTWTTTTDPVTGLPRYAANQFYTPEQKALLNTTQATGLTGGLTGLGLATNLAPGYSQAPDFLSGANSLTNQYAASVLPNFERFANPQTDQLRTQLLNSGLSPDSPAFRQQMDMLQDQQNRTFSQQIAQFQPQAFLETQQAYKAPIDVLNTLFGMGQPANLGQSLAGINIPQANLVTPSAQDAYNLNYQGQLNKWKAKVQAQNNWMSGLLGIGGSALGSMGGGAGGIGSGLGGAMSGIGSGIGDVFGGIGSGLGAVGSGIGDLFSGAGAGLLGLLAL